MAKVWMERHYLKYNRIPVSSVSASPHNHVFSLTTGICGPDKTRILMYFMQCDSMIKLGCVVKMASIHEEEVSNIYTGSLIICCNSNYCVMFSIV